MRKTGARRIQRPSVIQILYIFDPIDRIFDQLDSDGMIHVDTRGVPVFCDCEGVWHPTVPALLGWIELWERMKAKGRFQLDLEPLHKLCRKLELDTVLMEDDVANAKAVISECRRLFRGMDTVAVASMVRDQQIAIEIHNRQAQDGQKG